MTYQPTKIRYKNGKPTPESLAWARAQAWYQSVRFALSANMPHDAPWTGPVSVEIDVYFERPQRLLKKRSPQCRVRHTAAPDRDNLEKSVTDALKEAGLYADDSQVCAGEVRKWYAAMGCGPGVVIRASRIPYTEVD